VAYLLDRSGFEPGWNYCAAQGFKPDEVFLCQLNLRRVFDDEYPFLLWNEFSERVKKTCFTAASSTTDKDVVTIFYIARKLQIQATQAHEILDGEMAIVEFANGQGDTGFCRQSMEYPT
jgi:hypothetical protein